MSVIVALGIVYGLYKWYNKSSKNIEQQPISSSKENSHPGATEDADALIQALHEKKIEWLSFVEILDQTFQNEQKLENILLRLNAELYEKNEIPSAGFFVAEKNLSQIVGNHTISKIVINKTLSFFAIATDNGKVFYCKNEFYETESAETNCMYTVIEEVLSPVVGIGFIGIDKLFAISYANGELGFFNVQDEKSIHKIIQRSTDAEVIDCVFSKESPIFVTVTKDYEEQVWNIQEECAYICLSTVSFKYLIKPDHKIYLNIGLVMLLSENILSTNLFLNNIVDQKIEMYTEKDKTYSCLYCIPYQGTIICSVYDSESFLFAFYQKGGQDEGLYVYNILSQNKVAHFTPYDKQKQHPVQLYIKEDKIFCLYADGIMDMWHCDVDRQKVAQECIEKIIASLSHKHKKEFLKQFGYYLHNRTSENYHLLVKLGSIGLDKKDVQAELLRLQFLPPLHEAS